MGADTYSDTLYSLFFSKNATYCLHISMKISMKIKVKKYMQSENYFDKICLFRRTFVRRSAACRALSKIKE